MWALAAALMMLITPITPAAASGPQASLSTSSLNFGGVAWLQSATQNVVLTNTGDSPLTGVVVDFSQVYVPIDFAFISGSCPGSAFTLAPGAQCSIGVRFQPQSGGPRSAVMSVYDSASDSPQSVALSGSGTGAVVTFSPVDLLFPNVPVAATSAPQSFSAINAGDGPVTIASVVLGPGHSSWFAITSDACTGRTLGPGQRCSMSATATPDAVTSDAQDVTFTDNAGTGQQIYDFARSREGLLASGGGPLLDTYGPIPSFIEDVGTQSQPTKVLVHDSGTDPLQILSVVVDDPSSGFRISGDTCTGATVVVDTLFSPPSRCEVDLTFAPSAPGSFQANLVFHDNEFGGLHIDFGFQAVATVSAPQLVTLGNPTTLPLTVTGVIFSGTNPGAFGLASDTCSGQTVPAEGTCAVGVTMTPPFTYLFTATLSFNDNAPYPQPTVALKGEGQSPTFTITTSRLDFGNVRVSAQSSPMTFGITNTTSGPLSIGFLPGLASGCPSSLAAGASCMASVSVTPTTLGAQSTLLKVFDPSFNQQVVQLDYAGVTAEPHLESTGNTVFQRVGDTSVMYAFLRNGGQDDLHVGAVTLSTSSVTQITDDLCSNQIEWHRGEAGLAADDRRRGDHQRPQRIGVPDRLGRMHWSHHRPELLMPGCRRLRSRPGRHPDSECAFCRRWRQFAPGDTRERCRAGAGGDAWARDIGIRERGRQDQVFARNLDRDQHRQFRAGDQPGGYLGPEQRRLHDHVCELPERNTCARRKLPGHDRVPAKRIGQRIGDRRDRG